MPPYTYQVNYSKRITSGPLKGRLYHDYLRFASKADAVAFAALCNSGHEFTPCAGVDSYTADDVTITKL
jgi:hypothetical protein